MTPVPAMVRAMGCRGIVPVIRSGPVPSPGGGHDGSSRAAGASRKAATAGLLHALGGASSAAA